MATTLRRRRFRLDVKRANCDRVRRKTKNATGRAFGPDGLLTLPVAEVISAGRAPTRDRWSGLYWVGTDDQQASYAPSVRQSVNRR